MLRNLKLAAACTRSCLGRFLITSSTLLRCLIGPVVSLKVFERAYDVVYHRRGIRCEVPCLGARRVKRKLARGAKPSSLPADNHEFWPRTLRRNIATEYGPIDKVGDVLLLRSFRVFRAFCTVIARWTKAAFGSFCDGERENQA